MQPQTSYLLCATPRSGSTLLCEALTNTRIAGQPEEYFQTLKETGLPKRPREYFAGIDTAEISAILDDSSWSGKNPWQPAHGENYDAYLAKVLKRGTTPNGVFGAKVMWDYFDDLISKLRHIPLSRDLALPDLLSTIFPNLHYIWITRLDKVRQAVSLWKAIQTGTWRENKSLLPQSESSHADRELLFHYEAIHHLLQQIVADETAWRQYFERYGIKPFVIVYEELTAAYETTVLRILQYLRIPIPENLALTERRMKRQADTLSEEWVQRYHLLKRERETVQ